MILLMSVNPGFGGQKFLPITYEKIRRLRRMLDERRLETLIQIDGGVTPANAAFVSSYYGMRHYAVNLSVVVTNLLFASFGSTIAGALYDATGSYLSTDAMILVLAVLSAAVSFGIDLCDRRMLKRR